MTVARASRWSALRDELARWARDGVVVRLWLRDDDAVTVTPALKQLAALCSAHGVPYLIAAVPSSADEDLAAYLSGQQLAEVAAHGWSHQNYANNTKTEFPAERPSAEILRDLSEARSRIETLFGAKAVPLFVPPWNRMAPEAAALLPRSGFRAISILGHERSPDDHVQAINVHLDIIDWRGSRGGRNPADLISELTDHLAWARQNDRSAIGILTHHLVHDAAAWSFLEELFAETVGHPAVRWVRASELLK